jgi:ABC-type multidrug transport system fused ATPase/permease subunit
MCSGRGADHGPSIKLRNLEVNGANGKTAADPRTGATHQARAECFDQAQALRKDRVRRRRIQMPPREDAYAVRNLSFTVEPAEIVVMVGASGCGKSTTRQHIQRFCDVTERQILID